MRGQTLQCILTLCILLPVVSALWQLWSCENGHMTWEMAEVVQAAIQIAASCMILTWFWRQRQQAERARLASEARISLAAGIHELGLFEWTALSGKMQLSSHAERLFGVQPGTFDGGMEEWREHIRRHFNTDIRLDTWSATASRHHSFRLCSAGTDPSRIIEGSLYFYELPGDRGVSMVGIVMDATERERRSEMLRSRELELRSILETVPEAMITVDDTGLVRSFSTAAEKLFGHDAAEIAGQDIRLLLPDYAGAADPPSFHASASSPQITIARDRQGNDMPVELVVSKTTIGNEHFTIVFVRSLREQIATQNRLSELRKQLMHASRVSAMGEIGAVLAHELNQPLTATANFLGAVHRRLGMDDCPEQIRELVELANLEVLRAGEIIRRMRAFVAKGELDIRAFPLNELIADALQLAWSRTRQAGVHLHYQPNDSGPVVLADQVQIQQVLVNIICNALETFASHRTERPEIIICAGGQADGNVLIRLLDNGPGFPPSIINRPFEAFVSTRANGLGLGLSICRRIVEGHGGLLRLGNRPEGGAVIEFTLPVCRDLKLKAAECP